MEVCKVEVKNIDNGKSLVCTSSINKGLEKYTGKSYVVSNSQKDEFIKNIKRKENKSTGLTSSLILLCTTAGAIAGYKLPVTRIDMKPYCSFVSGFIGLAAGALIGNQLDIQATEKILQKYNATRV